MRKKNVGKAKRAEPEVSYAGLTKDQQLEAIANAESEEELDAIWEQLEVVGMSREGLTFAAVLERKHALGVELSDEETVAVELAAMRREHGKTLPPIEGTFGGE